MKKSGGDRLVPWLGTCVVLAVISLTGFMVAQLGGAQPAVIGAALAGLAAVLAAIPPIIKALRDR